MPSASVDTVRDIFRLLLTKKQFVENKNKTGSKTIEIIGASFIADEDTIFGEVNYDWVHRESQWYHSQSLNVNDIPGGAPQIWKTVADAEGMINSNYGWCIFSKENFNQFDKCVEQLKQDSQSRRAEMIYTRPSIQLEYDLNGRSDFICTEAVQYFIRNDELITVVKMRSNDAWAGYRGDLQWQKEVRQMLIENLLPTYPNLKAGQIIWNAGSLHIYERNFYLVDYYSQFGETHISKSDYQAKFPNSVYV
jgi:thymidylate synthase